MVVDCSECQVCCGAGDDVGDVAIVSGRSVHTPGVDIPSPVSSPLARDHVAVLSREAFLRKPSCSKVERGYALRIPGSASFLMISASRNASGTCSR